MKPQSFILASAILGLSLVSVHAQFSPRFTGAITNLFGNHQSFSATLVLETKDPSNGSVITMPSQLAFDTGRSRFEVDLSRAQGGQMRPAALAQMKSLGIDHMVVIAQPGNNVAYLIYPGAQAYAQSRLPVANPTNPPANFKVKTTELGRDTVDGHPCVKNKVIVTSPEGTAQEFTVWNATDLKQFPVKIVETEDGRPVTMLFKNINLSKPAAGLFEPPPNYSGYRAVPVMMEAIVVKHSGGGAGHSPLSH
ncbi:MAG TPA: hypothetical protein VKU37_14600 [Verrucomicrobiae bacterium]|nr:hypothetical protein [Verrucomicrobiae bacterium]